MLHPQILVNQLGKVQLPGLEHLPMSNNKPILHQAVLVTLLGTVKKGVLTLSTLFSLGFDVNALDEYGETALSPIFSHKMQGQVE